MNSILLIYKKNQNCKNQITTQGVVKKYLSGKKPELISHYDFGRLTLLIYSRNLINREIFQQDNKVFGYNGIMYPPFDPAFDGRSLRNQIYDYFSKEYDKQGRKVFQKLKGKYNAFVFDKGNQALIIANDQLGMHPAFCMEDNDAFLLCSEYEALMEYKNEKTNFNSVSIIEYLLFGAPQNNNSFFRNISVFPAGFVLKLHEEKVIEKECLYKTKISKTKDSTTGLALQYNTVFRYDELNLLLKWYPELEITLTGGADTRMILGAIAPENYKTYNFVTFTSKAVENELNQDIIIAELLSKELGLNHHVEEKQYHGIDKLDNGYFSCLRNGNDFGLYGYLGSESVRFGSTYELNIPVLTRQMLSEKSFYRRIPDAFIPVKSGYSLKKLIKSSVEYVSQYLNIPGNRISDELYHNFDNVLERFSVPYKEVVYTNLYLIRSFFSRHCGGAKSNALMPAVNSQHFISPFTSPELLEIIWSADHACLTNKKNGLLHELLKLQNPELLKIPSNSDVSNNHGTSLQRFSYGFNPNEKNKILYPAVDNIFYKNLDYSLPYLRSENIKMDFFINNSQYQYIWADLLLWLNYVMNNKNTETIGKLHGR